MVENSASVGLDVHKETISVALAGREDPVFRGEIRNRRSSLRRLVRVPMARSSVCATRRVPRGYGVYCEIAAPSLIPRRVGDHEAMRDLTRARKDMTPIEFKARQHLGAFLLRHATGGGVQAHFRRLGEQAFSHPDQPVVSTSRRCWRRNAGWRISGSRFAWQCNRGLLQPVVGALISRCGVITTVTVLAEPGDLTRFDSPRQLMSYPGLVPSEHSSGSQGRQGITRTGNSHVRRVLVEAAWSCRFPATAHLRRKAAAPPGRWPGQHRNDFAPAIDGSRMPTRSGDHRGGPRTGGPPVDHRLRHGRRAVA